MRARPLSACVDRQCSETTDRQDGGSKSPPGEHIAEVVHANGDEGCAGHSSRSTAERENADSARSLLGQASYGHRDRDDADGRRRVARRKRKADGVNQRPGRPRSLRRGLRCIGSEIHEGEPTTMTAASSHRRRASSNAITTIAKTATAVDVTNDRELADRASNASRCVANSEKASRSKPSSPCRGTSTHIPIKSAPPASATNERTITTHTVDADCGPVRLTNRSVLPRATAPIGRARAAQVAAFRGMSSACAAWSKRGDRRGRISEPESEERLVKQASVAPVKFRLRIG